ncbi:MAG: tRNA (adenosine(37)-N6)-dimethylallyltransferase MiaA [Mariprofundus sp.]|nr:tRNA (adenosine(37)-N6)-dimethylallyltransferase MiaA [Mariprofundus sp.]
MNKLYAVALMGATGTGKSALALSVAKQSGNMIISCDSMQLYRGLDIGTATPTAAELATVKHAMVNCCELPDYYSAARWADEARVVIRQQNALGKTPLIVGGTGLYLRALIEGLADIPPEDATIRARFESMHWIDGIKPLYHLLQQRDPVIAAQLKEADSQRILRALVVQESTGIPLSTWQQRPSNVEIVHCPIFVLDLAREILRQRMADRFMQMMEDGWLHEVRWLASVGLADTHPAMRAVGYRHLLDHLLERCSLEEAVQKGITATRRYGKRQVTWFMHQTPSAIHGDGEQLRALIAKALGPRKE